MQRCDDISVCEEERKKNIVVTNIKKSTKNYFPVV